MIKSINIHFKPTRTTNFYTLSLHDALPISLGSTMVTIAFRELSSTSSALRLVMYVFVFIGGLVVTFCGSLFSLRSEEHTSELQSRFDLVCRLLLEKKNRGSNPSGEPRHRRR